MNHSPSTDRDDTLDMLRQSAKALVPDSDLSRIRGLRFSSPGFDRTAWARIADMGWPGLLVSETLGGSGLGIGALCALAEELGRGLAPEPVLAAAIANSVLGEDEIASVLSGDRIVLPALHERSNDLGDDPQTRFENGKVTGTKRFVLSGGGADAFLASTVSGLVLVDAKAKGVAVHIEPARDGGEIARIDFDGAPATAVSGNASDLADWIALANCAYLFGAMERLFDITLDFLKTRKQFGQLIGSFQVLQHRVVDLKIQLEVSRAVLAEAIAAVEDDAEQARPILSRAKARIGDAAMKIAQDSVQLHGAIGITDEYDAGLFVRKILTMYNAGGSASAHRLRHLDLMARQPASDETNPTVATDDLSDDYNDWPDDTFRRHIRTWIEANYPRDMRYPTHRLRRAQTKIWYDLLSEKGWLAPAWPREHGGMGLNATKRLIMIEELERHGCSRYSDQGVLMIGPLLMNYGTEEQRRFFLPKIITGEHIWSQGYSEPGAGSDLAGLRTSARLDGYHWIVNGQKIWTTLAHDSNWIYVLVRTDPDAKKQNGISFLLMPIDTPGITVRPIQTLGMTEEFCEVFFDDVRVPKDSIVGEVNRGWQMAKALLGFERIFVGSPAQSANAFNRLEALLEKLGIAERADIRAVRAQLAADLADHAALYESFADKLRKGEAIGPEVSMLKINQTELYKTICRAGIDLAGDYAAFAGAPDDLDGLEPSGLWIQALQATIYGGTSEIQRNILAKNVLALP